MQNESPYIPVLQIRPTGLLCFYRYEGPKSLNQRRNLSTFNTRQRTARYSGDMTKGSIKRCKRAIQLLVASTKSVMRTNPKTGKNYPFKLSFITLTLPSAQGNLSDKQIKSDVLWPWLKYARRVFKLGSYVWKAEKQQNGNIHFHITCDTYIDKNQLKLSWNNRLKKVGLLDGFIAKHKHDHPNSTDVHAVRNIKNMAGYLLKYMTKPPQYIEAIQAQPPFRKAKRKPEKHKAGIKFRRIHNKASMLIDGKTWDCSLNLKTKINCEFDMDLPLIRKVQNIENRFPDNVLTHERFTFIVFNYLQLCQNFDVEHVTAYNKWLADIRLNRQAA